MTEKETESASEALSNWEKAIYDLSMCFFIFVVIVGFSWIWMPIYIWIHREDLAEAFKRLGRFVCGKEK